jgi:energy-coupling factor transporter ATP-binding protein EcfA2
MQLKSARVTNFRSVEDSGLFEIDDVTCLVGKNEAGKTALLQALCGLNPHPATPMVYDKERDYPRRHLSEYAQHHGTKEAVVIETHWLLDDDECAEISDELGIDPLTSKSVKISRHYGDKSPVCVTDIDYAALLEYLYKSEKLDASERASIGQVSTTDQLREVLKKLTSPTDKHKKLLAKVQAWPGQNVSGFLSALILPHLPRFMYFSHYDRMHGHIRLDTFEQRKASDPKSIESGELVFVDFLEYAGTSIKEINAAETYEGLNARCEAASNRITDELLEYWTQNPHLEIDVRVTKAEPKDPVPYNSGVIARARVRNNLHKMSVPFSERSAGFVWFFSFLVKFAQVKRDDGGLVLLLDEPGLTLHGKAQYDLLRYFDERLAPSHQVLFSTHSPFMVPADKMTSIRIVEDRMYQKRPNVWATEGTKVRSDALAVDRDTLFPLQGALGYEVTQSLFVGKHVALVEGPGDILYLEALAAALRRRGKQGIDRKVTLCPAGGIDKIQPFIALFSGAKLDVSAITDYSRNDKRKLDSILTNKVMSADRLLTFAGVLGKDEADIEDIFDPAVFTQIVNATFELRVADALDCGKLAASGAGDRLLKQVEACFRVMGAGAPEFDHFSPAEWLFRNQGVLDADTPEVNRTLDNAAKVIAAINATFA